MSRLRRRTVFLLCAFVACVLCTSAVAAGTSSASSAARADRVTSARTLVRRFFRQYLAATTPEARRAVVVRYGTKRLVHQFDSITDFDTLICAQNTPVSWRIGATASNSKMVFVNVRESWGDDSVLVVRTHVVGRAGAQKLDSTGCPTVTQ